MKIERLMKYDEINLSRFILLTSLFTKPTIETDYIPFHFIFHILQI